MSSRPPHTCLQPCDVRGRIGPLALLPGLNTHTTPTLHPPPSPRLHPRLDHTRAHPPRPAPCPCRQGRATTLVLSHGYGAGLALYFGLFDRLLDAGKYDRVIAFDWNGFGVRRTRGSAALVRCPRRGPRCELPCSAPWRGQGVGRTAARGAGCLAAGAPCCSPLFPVLPCGMPRRLACTANIDGMGHCAVLHFGVTWCTGVVKAALRPR